LMRWANVSWTEQRMSNPKISIENVFPYFLVCFFMAISDCFLLA